MMRLMRCSLQSGLHEEGVLLLVVSQALVAQPGAALQTTAPTTNKLSFSSVTSVTRSVLPLEAGGARKSGSQIGSAQTARWRHAQQVVKGLLLGTAVNCVHDAGVRSLPDSSWPRPTHHQVLSCALRRP